MSEANESEMVMMAVNQDVCIGSGQCEMLEEETFLVDDDTVIAGVIGTAMLPMDRAQKVIDTCPTQAISIAVVDSSRPAAEELRSRVDEPLGEGSRPAAEEEE